ncbi:unnamed protein product [Ectocarpus sp. 12 AP-2014]
MKYEGMITLLLSNRSRPQIRRPLPVQVSSLPLCLSHILSAGVVKMSNGETVRNCHGICAMGEETGHQSSLRCDESSPSSPQPTERDMQTKKRKRRPRDVQPIPRRSKRIRNKIAASAAAISAPDAVVISDNANKNDQINHDQAAAATGTPRSPMVRNTTTNCKGRKRENAKIQKTKNIAAP